MFTPQAYGYTVRMTSSALCVVTLRPGTLCAMSPGRLPVSVGTGHLCSGATDRARTGFSAHGGGGFRGVRRRPEARVEQVADGVAEH